MQKNFFQYMHHMFRILQYHLNMNACIAVPKEEDEHLSNDSYHFHEKTGFHLVGPFHNSGYKFNTWYDMIWMEKIIGEHQAHQRNVRYGEWTVE